METEKDATKEAAMNDWYWFTLICGGFSRWWSVMEQNQEAG